ncbi:MAG: HlyC/CorC family transporter [Anaerolineales bacterium]|nr:HlyC/CorC family transporter [Anaerolineales bacterium]MCB8960269.1 HlyC/CorC family transporter [Ardenticatenales bacterium]
MPETIFEIALVLLLIVLNGLFAMSELALVSARPIRLQQMAQQGNRGAVVALELADSPNRFLSTVQVGITLIGILAGAFGGANIAGELANLMASWPGIGRYANSISLAIVVGAITFLSVVVGELVPKRIALGNAEQIAALVARPMGALARLATPVVNLLGGATDLTLRLLGIRTVTDESVNEEEIRTMISQGAKVGAIDEAEKEMVDSIFRLGDRPLEAMMTPRLEIVWLDIHASEAELHELMRSTPHGRYPVCDGDLDRLLGILQVKDLLTASLAGQPLDIRAVLQEPLLVPESLPVLKALERFKQSGQHMALLFDEYGGIEGLVTLINILEAIVGDIPTETEVIDPPIVQRQDGTWLVDGLISSDDFKEAFNIRHLPGEGKYQTLAGYVLFMIGDIPTTGSYFDWGGYRFEVADMDRYRVDKLLLQRLPEGEEPAGEDEI